MLKRVIFGLIILSLVINGCFRPADKRKQAVEHYINAMVNKSGKLDDEAIASLKNSVKVDPEFTLAHSMMGQMYKKQGKYELAANAYEKACALNRWSFKNHFNLGEVYYTLKKFKEAINIYGRAVIIKPEHVQANFNLGASYFEDKQYKQALKYYGKVAKLDPDNDLVLSLMGDLYGLQKDPEKALDIYRKSLDINPEQPDIIINIAKIYLSTGRWDPANLMLNKAIEQMPADPYPHFCMGYIALQQDKPQKAWEHYQDAIKLNDKYYEAMNGIAVANILIHNQNPKNLSRIKSAITYWQKSLAINPDQADIAKKLEKYSKMLED